MAALDSMRKLSWFVSYRRLSCQFQFSLSAVTRSIYVDGWEWYPAGTVARLWDLAVNVKQGRKELVKPALPSL